MEHPFVEIHRIAEGLWALDEIGKTIMYLYAGRERALLVDTGFGLSDLNAIGRELCPGRELVVVNSHVHPDHDGGNCQFERVYCGRFDEPNAHMPVDAAAREGICRNFLDGNPRAQGGDLSRWQPGPAECVVPLREGDAIDLGGIRLEVLETPGHTLGSIALFDRENSRLFTGDMALTWQVWGQLAGSSALSEYAHSLERLAALGARHVHPAHGDPGNRFGCPIWELPPRALEVYAQGTRDILDGRSTGEPFTCFAGDGLCAQFDIGGMVYDPARLGRRGAL